MTIEQQKRWLKKVNTKLKEETKVVKSISQGLLLNSTMLRARNFVRFEKRPNSLSSPYKRSRIIL